MDERGRRRILAWIDLNVPYYGSSETAYPDNRGCRRLYPETLDDVLNEVADRRCGSCHADGSKGSARVPRNEWVRITRPELNAFLLAPLAESAGGTQRCGEAVFRTTGDPDYAAVLALFDSIRDTLAKTPRMDMPGGLPAAGVCRDTQ